MSKIKTDDNLIDEILCRSIDTIYPSKEDFRKMLKSGKQLRIYMGIDPTATYVHLGHATNYIILKRLHELGHKIIVLVGDFTAMIGDPSDKSAARVRLNKDQVKEYLKSYKKQIGKILDFDSKTNPIELQFNSDWLAKLTFADAVDLASNFTVQRMLERDNFEKRIKENKPLYVHEFFYPLMQGYDTVALKADVEIGGTDQTFNMLAGRTLAKVYQNREKIVMTTTLLVNPVTGEKLMSKSLGTGIGLDLSPADMYGKAMTLPDEAIIQVLIDCTYMTMAEIKKLEQQLKDGTNPRDIKMTMAYELVKTFYTDNEAQEAQDYFVKVFQKNERPTEDMPEKKIKADNLVDVLVELELAESNSEAKRVIKQGGIKINDQVVDDIGFEIPAGQHILQKGKRFFYKIIK